MRLRSNLMHCSTANFSKLDDSLPLLLSKPKTSAGIHLKIKTHHNLSHISSLHFINLYQGFRPNLLWQSRRLTWENDELNDELMPKKWLLSERPGEGLAKVLHLTWVNILKIKEANGWWGIMSFQVRLPESGVCSSLTVESCSWLFYAQDFQK